jgi:DNA-directed RNA polymerase subunit F
MILEKKAVTLAETKAIVDKLEEKEEIKKYLKKFTKLTREKANSLMKEVRELNNPKIKGDDLIKLADFPPKDAEDVNKIFTDSTLNEEEVNAILEITKKH